MAIPRKSHHTVAQERAARDELFRAAPVIGHYRGVGEVSVDMTFFDPEGKLRPSPRSRRFAADMQAYFDFPCPQHDCTGGGFDATADLQGALGKHRNGHIGKLSCHGTRPRNDHKGLPCNIELTYVVTIREKAAAAA
jgi:hypothetical protein